MHSTMRLLPHGAWDRRGAPEGPQEVEDRSEGYKATRQKSLSFQPPPDVSDRLALRIFPPKLLALFSSW